MFINNIVERKPLPVYGKGENIRDWLYVADHVEAMDLVFHKGESGRTYNIGGMNERTNIELVKALIQTTDRLLGRQEGEDLGLIRFVTDRPGHDARYAIDSSRLREELGWKPAVSFNEGLEKTVRWYLDNKEWLEQVTSGEYAEYYEKMYRNR